MKKLFIILLVLISLVSLSSANALCGNGIVEAGEQCDGTNLDGSSCSIQPNPTFSDAELGCYPAGTANECKFMTMLCYGYPDAELCYTDSDCSVGQVCGSSYYCEAGVGTQDTTGTGNFDITIGLNPTLADPGAAVQGTVSVKNNGANTVNILTITSNALELSTDVSVKIAAPSIGSISSLGAGQTKNVAFTLNVPATQFGTYNGIVTVVDSANANNQNENTYSLIVNQKNAFIVADSAGNELSELLLDGQEDETVSGTLYVKNTGSTILSVGSSSFAYDITKFERSNRQIGLTFGTISSILPGENKAVGLTANIPNNMNLDTYSDTVTLTANGVQDAFNLKVRVQPEVCTDGIIGNLDISINDPDNNDEYAPGDTIKLDVTVDNNDDDDLDVIVEAFLYNIDQDDEIAREESSSDSIDSGDDLDFEFDLDIPEDNDLDESDEYILYVKAYEDGQEDDHCAQDSLTIDIQRDSKKVVVKRFDVRPTFVNPGEAVSFEVLVENQGTKDMDDVYVELREGTLSIGERTTEFELKKYSKDDNDATRRFTVTIPESATPGDYFVEAIVYYDGADESDSEFVTLKVGGEESISGKSPSLSLTTTTSSFDASQNSGRLHLVITNNEANDLTGTLEINPVGSWANQVTQSVSLHKGDNNLYLELPLSDAEGKQSANVVVRIDGYDAKQFTLNFDVAGKKSALDGLKDSTALLVVGYAALILVGLYLLKLIFARPKRKSLI